MRELFARTLRARGLQPSRQTGCHAGRDTSPLPCAVFIGALINPTINIKKIAKTLPLAKQNYVSHARAEIYDSLCEQSLWIGVRERIPLHIRK